MDSTVLPPCLGYGNALTVRNLCWTELCTWCTECTYVSDASSSFCVLHWKALQLYRRHLQRSQERRDLWGRHLQRPPPRSIHCRSTWWHGDRVVEHARKSSHSDPPIPIHMIKTLRSSMVEFMHAPIMSSVTNFFTTFMDRCLSPICDNRLCRLTRDLPIHQTTFTSPSTDRCRKSHIMSHTFSSHNGAPGPCHNME